MMIHEITAKVGKHRARKRIGRGHGSGHGKTSGRGHKGAGSRSGHVSKAGFEGGQMPWFRRIPKRGFSNAMFRRDFQIVNLGEIARRFKEGDTINGESLAAAGLVRDPKGPVKILGEGEAPAKLDVHAHKLSAAARRKIEDAGGSVTEIPITKWVRPKRKSSGPAAQ